MQCLNHPTEEKEEDGEVAAADDNNNAGENGEGSEGIKPRKNGSSWRRDALALAAQCAPARGERWKNSPCLFCHWMSQKYDRRDAESTLVRELWRWRQKYNFLKFWADLEMLWSPVVANHTRRRCLLITNGLSFEWITETRTNERANSVAATSFFPFLMRSSNVSCCSVVLSCLPRPCNKWRMTQRAL